MSNEELINYAIKAKNNSYSPYSNFKVGCALLATNGKVYLGCNIENCAFSPTNCAERTALYSAIASGEKSFEKIAIVGNENQICYPCGVCRQVISELAPNIEIICAKSTTQYEIHTINELLPYSFSKNDLN